MSGEITDAASVGDVPETHGAVGRARGHVIDVGMEGDDVDVGQMPGENAQGLMMIGGP